MGRTEAKADKSKKWIGIIGIMALLMITVFVISLFMCPPKPDNFVKWANYMTEDSLEDSIERGVWLQYTDFNTTPQSHIVHILTTQEREQLVEWLHTIDEEQNIVYEHDYERSDNNIQCFLWIDEKTFRCYLYYEPIRQNCLRIYIEWQDGEKREAAGNMNPKAGAFFLKNSPLVDYVQNFFLESNSKAHSQYD